MRRVKCTNIAITPAD